MKYFGTDGIRGVVDDNLNFDHAYKVGRSIAIIINKKQLSKNVIIGKDTRLSGDLLVHALACGLIDYGVNVKLIGIVPTGCVSYLSSKLDVGFGVMITASHNTPDMNGIKVINNLGYKLSSEEEKEIEEIIDNCQDLPVFKKGTIVEDYELVNKYINHVKQVGCELFGIKIALDCANGSNHKIAPKVFRELGAEVIAINFENNGELINVDCGAMHIEKLKQEVLTHKCDIGFAFDGDADRLVVVLNDGTVLKGDEIIYLFAKYLKQKDELNSLTVVGTIMTNLGCEESLNEIGIKLVRVDVGDRNVIEKMRDNNYSLGGESSGHICLRNYNTTCDALINALQLLKVINKNFDEVKTMLLPLKIYGNVLKNITVTKEFRKGYDTNYDFKQKLNEIINSYSGVKIIVRPSGTESVLRIFAESNDNEMNKKAVCHIEKFVKNYINKKLTN